MWRIAAYAVVVGAVSWGALALTVGSKDPVVEKTGRFGVQGECVAATTNDHFGDGSVSPERAMTASGFDVARLERDEPADGRVIFFRSEEGVRREAHLVLRQASGSWVWAESEIARNC